MSRIGTLLTVRFHNKILFCTQIGSCYYSFGRQAVTRLPETERPGKGEGRNLELKYDIRGGEGLTNLFAKQLTIAFRANLFFILITGHIEQFARIRSLRRIPSNFFCPLIDCGSDTICPLWDFSLCFLYKKY